MKFKDLDLKKSYTYADYLSWKLEETVELIRGKIFKMSPAPNIHHQEISTKLLSRIEYFISNKHCKVFHAPFDVRLPLPPSKVSNDKIDTVVQPDISVICDLDKLDMKGCLGAPDWIIEIVSPGSVKKDVKEKYDIYEFSGVKEYWLVYPGVQTVTVYLLDEKSGKYIGQRPYSRSDKISPSVFPKLAIDLNEVFPEPMLEEEMEEYLRLS